MKFKLFASLSLALCTSVACGAEVYKVTCATRHLTEDFDTREMKWQSNDVCQSTFEKVLGPATATISDAVKAKYPPSKYEFLFFMDEVDGDRKVDAVLFLKSIAENKKTKPFVIMYESADEPWDQRNRAMNILIALSQAVEFINRTCSSDDMCDLFSSDGGFLQKKIHAKMK